MKFSLQTLILACMLLCFGKSANAQFSYDSVQTFFVCNATGSQTSVSAFSDGNGGTYSYWIDKRNGLAGSAIYGQHLDSLGFPQWTANGKLLATATSKEIWNMKAVQWQSGTLIAWVQGGFGIGGDTIHCMYYDQAGIAQWSTPTVVANKQGQIIYVDGANLDIYTTNTNATITFSLVPSGGNTYFSFNKIDNTGNLSLPINSISYTGGGYYYHSADDHHGGFFVAASTGGLGAHIYVGHFDAQGNSTISSPVDISTVAGGRGNDQWNIFCGSDTSAYVAWDNSSPGDVHLAKIKADGSLPYGSGGAKPVCTVPGYKALTYGTIANDTIYIIWADPRQGASNYKVYMQKLTTDGDPLWTTDGVLLSDLSNYSPYPKLAITGNEVVATYVSGSKFRAQQIHPDSTIGWTPNGIAMNTNNLPSTLDYVIVPSNDGSTTIIWKESGENICASRIRQNGTLTNISSPTITQLELFPNPATDQFSIQVKNTGEEKSLIRIFNANGQLVSEQTDSEKGEHQLMISTSKLSSGIYTVTVTGTNLNRAGRLSIVRN